MGMNNVLLLCQLAGYIIALILALCILIPMSLHQDQFKRHCLLFSTGCWQEKDGQLNVDWASQGYCNYTIFVGVLLFLVAVVQIYRTVRYLVKEMDSSFFSAFLDVLVSIWLAAMSAIGALMITLGFATWCALMVQRFPSCKTAAGQTIDTKDGIKTDGFYVQLGTAQFGAWASFAMWVGLSVFALLKLCRYHQTENMRVSMYRERQRLICESSCEATCTGGRDSAPDLPEQKHE